MPKAHLSAGGWFKVNIYIYIDFLGYILFGLKGIVQSIMRTSVKTNSKPTSQQLKQRLPGRQIGTRLPVQLSMMPMKTIRSRECAPSAWESWAKKPKAQDGTVLGADFTSRFTSPHMFSHKFLFVHGFESI